MSDHPRLARSLALFLGAIALDAVAAAIDRAARELAGAAGMVDRARDWMIGRAGR